MKAIRAFKFAACVMLVTGSLQVYAQGGSTPVAAASDTTASAKQQYKAAKAANRALSRKVLAAIAKDKHMSTASVTVRARDGSVTIQGMVPEQSQIDRATTIAKGVAGVTAVSNTLTVSPYGN